MRVRKWLYFSSNLQPAHCGCKPCCSHCYAWACSQTAWINNYGVWCDEFEAMGLEDCFKVVWPKAVVHLSNGEEGVRCGRGSSAARPGRRRRDVLGSWGLGYWG